MEAEAAAPSPARAPIARPVAPKGVFAAVLTPLDRHLEPDRAAFTEHCAWLLANGCDGLSMLGTTGEANSLPVAQRIRLLEAAAASLPVARMIPGTGACALADTVELSRRAVEIGCGGVLALPPFYYKNPTEDGLYAFFAALIERVGDARLRLYLYHFPQMSAVPIPAGLIERLAVAFPGIVAGVKDSSGDWSYSRALLERLPGFGVYSGSEEFLLRNLRAGGAGCISATVNVTAPLAGRLWAGRAGGEADRLQSELTDVRLALQRYPLVAALKAVKAQLTDRDAWLRILPPLSALPSGERDRLLAALAALPQFKPVLDSGRTIQ